MKTEKAILLFAQRIRAISQNGLHYALSNYDTERYTELLEISDALVSCVSGLDKETIQSLFLPMKEYITPKVDIRAVVFNDKEEILLVREKADGLWSLPGGWADVGCSPSEVAVKEVKEETGLEVQAERLLAVMDMRKHAHPPIPFYVYKFFILCRIGGGVFTEVFDILDKGFFPLNDLPPLSLERILPDQIRLVDEYRRDPAKGVYLD
ncbi:NUDIX hydrolase [Parabacteroides sp. PF5-6]|uniref:NUDIX hydrolase n=1 Tax=Parabacteroides sp. PF5-6 TaxID=1742403 RepID=UPI002405DFE0|nr:NUDIX hydrolase [Parabacteroides sp. PF5-6]MDF9831646.1 ADP-ribose pyrophosphatase YjhB (NUDIX family) [Parabacteroides sp. PF5-6]